MGIEGKKTEKVAARETVPDLRTERSGGVESGLSPDKGRKVAVKNDSNRKRQENDKASVAEPKQIISKGQI